MPVPIFFRVVLAGALFFLISTASPLWAGAVDLGATGAVLGDDGRIYGGEIGYFISPSLRTRFTYSTISHQQVQLFGALQFIHEANQENMRLSLDWFPFKGIGFYSNLGVTLRGDPVKFTVKPTDGRDYTVNGVVYSSAQIGSVNGITETHKKVPYIGVGYLYLFERKSKTGWYFQTEVGMVSNLEPYLRIESPTAAASPQLHADLQAQADQERGKFPDSYTLYAITIGYRF